MPAAAPPPGPEAVAGAVALAVAAAEAVRGGELEGEPLPEPPMLLPVGRAADPLGLGAAEVEAKGCEGEAPPLALPEPLLDRLASSEALGRAEGEGSAGTRAVLSARGAASASASGAAEPAGRVRGKAFCRRGSSTLQYPTPELGTSANSARSPPGPQTPVPSRSENTTVPLPNWMAGGGGGAKQRSLCVSALRWRAWHEKGGSGAGGEEQAEAHVGKGRNGGGDAGPSDDIAGEGGSIEAGGEWGSSGTEK